MNQLVADAAHDDKSAGDPCGTGSTCNSDSDCPECQLCPGPNSVCIADSSKDGALCSSCDGGSCSCYSLSEPGKCLPATCSGYCTSYKGYQFGTCKSGIGTGCQYSPPEGNTYDCTSQVQYCCCQNDCPTECVKRNYDKGECYTGTKPTFSSCSGQTRTYYYGIGSSGQYSCNFLLLQGCWCEDKNVCQTDCGGSQACNGATIGSGCSKEGEIGTCDSNCQCITKECNPDIVDDCKNKGVTCEDSNPPYPNRYAKCNPTTHICDVCGECFTSDDCKVGCCDKGKPSGMGQCVSSGIYSPDPSWLCTT